MQVKCTSCGASQNISEAQNCDFCGNLIEIESAKNNYVSFLNGESGNLMSMAETAIDATNWDEALQYFNRVLEKEINNSDAWLGKGIAIVYTSKIGDLKISEAIAYWKNAIKHASNENAMSSRVAKEIDQVINSFYPTIENHYIEFSGLKNSYEELVNRFAILEKAQAYATQLDKENITLFETGLNLCKRVIQIPKSITSSNKTAALATAAIALASDNKYQRQNASASFHDAKSREKEIKNASTIIIQLETKYVEGIRRINPESMVFASGSKPTADDPDTINLVLSTYENDKLNFGKTATVLRENFNISLVQSHELIYKILINNGLMSEAEVRKEKRPAQIFGVIFMIIIFIIIYLINKK